MNGFIHNSNPLPNQVADYLIRWIRESNLNPGDRMPTELELTEQLNLGRSTVREAIAILKNRNVVEVRRGCGTFLSQTPGNISDPLGLDFVQDRVKLAKDWSALRRVIEPAIAEMAAQNATQEDIEKIKYWNDRINQDIAEEKPHLESDQQFHRALASATKNVVMDRLVPVIVEGIQEFMTTINNSASLATINRSSTLATRHLHNEIVRAVSEHDGEAAKKAMEALLGVNEERLREKFGKDWEETLSDNK